MDRSVPLWLFLLVVLSFVVFTVGFGFFVKREVDGKIEGGSVSELAYRVASFPELVGSVASEASAQLAGEADRFITVPRYMPPGPAFTPVPGAEALGLNGLVHRVGTANATPGWRILVGTFDRGDTFQHGAVLLSPEMEAVHFWAADETDLGDVKVAPPYRKFLHGLAVLPDASIVFAFDGGQSLQRIDRCGRPIWQVAGRYHHSVTLSEDGEHLWVLRNGFDLVEVSATDGTVTREMTLGDIIEANPGIDILEIRKFHHDDVLGNARYITERPLYDPFHINDVDPLPGAIADAFDGFSAGDLLVSSRSLNLVFIVDPDTQQVKWWRIGAWKRQHDPDWLPNGTISVFDNRMNREHSRIVEIDPETYETRVRVDGEPLDFYTRIRGKHQQLSSGNVLITSSQQGRALEVGPDGTAAIEFLTLKGPDDRSSHALSDMIWLPPAAMTRPAGCGNES